ncbi:hypothetical protein KY342_01610 [Candidatus Woesearchaeota archaeon]|nr:hypothetical protein [Candidatus Woesearchaeota archaeon]
MKLENTVKKESFFSRIGRKFVAPVVLLASAGCGAKEFFRPDYFQAEVNIETEGSGVRLKEGNKSFKSDIEYSENKSIMKDTNSSIEEARLSAEVNIHSKSKNITVSPIIETVERVVFESSGQPVSYLHQKNGLPFLAVDVKGKLPGVGKNYWRVRPFVNPTIEETIIGPLDVTKSGFFADAKIETMYMVLTPLLSYVREDIDFGTGIITPSELQYGLSLSNSAMQNTLYFLGLYTSGVGEDVEEERVWYGTAAGNVTSCPGWLRRNPVGVNFSYDNLLSIGVHGSFGGNSVKNKKALSRYIRQVQGLMTERGLPVLQNRADDARLTLEKSINAPFFYFFGAKWQTDVSGGDAKPKFYGYIGGTKNFSNGMRMIVGATAGPGLGPSLEDPAKKRYGGVVGVDFDGPGFYFLTLEHVDYETLKDKDFIGIKALFKK